MTSEQTTRAVALAQGLEEALQAGESVHLVRTDLRVSVPFRGDPRSSLRVVVVFSKDLKDARISGPMPHRWRRSDAKAYSAALRRALDIASLGVSLAAALDTEGGPSARS